MRMYARTGRNTGVSLGFWGMLAYGFGWCILAIIKLTILFVLLIAALAVKAFTELRRYNAQRQQHRA
jgi:hypothetical protein